MFANIPEEEQIERFISAYQKATGVLLECVDQPDRPDFICKKPDRSHIGIEVTLITRTPDMSFAEDALNGIRHMEASDALAHIFNRIERKDNLRKTPDWQLSEHCYLLLSIPDCPLSELEPELTEDLMEEFSENGFQEIWIADFSLREEYRSVELFCLKPAQLWGHYPEERGKPFG